MNALDITGMSSIYGKRIETMPNHPPLKISIPMPGTYLVETARNDGTSVAIFRLAETVKDCFEKPFFVTESNSRGVICQFINLFTGYAQAPKGYVTLKESGVTFQFKGFAKNPTEIIQVINGQNDIYIKKCTPEQLKKVVAYIRKGII